MLLQWCMTLLMFNTTHTRTHTYAHVHCVYTLKSNLIHRSIILLAIRKKQQMKESDKDYFLSFCLISVYITNDKYSCASVRSVYRKYEFKKQSVKLVASLR